MATVDITDLGGLLTDYQDLHTRGPARIGSSGGGDWGPGVDRVPSKPASRGTRAHRDSEQGLL